MIAHRPARLLLLALAALLAGCSDDEGVGSVGFAPAGRTPAPGQVALTQAQASGQTISLAVRVREVTGIRRADLTLGFDPVRLVFLGLEDGILLEGTDGSAAYQAVEQIPGRLNVLAVRTAAGTVDATAAEEPMVFLVFQAVTPGTSALTFAATSRLEDEAGDPIAGVTFHGGTVTAF